MNEEDIPHGHGGSYKKGICDGLLDEKRYEGDVHETHLASYRRGVAEGRALMISIADRVKD